MNLVKLITDQLSGEALRGLSSLLGADEQSTERAAAAAAPSLLSALGNLASSNDGANKLAGVLNGLDTSSLGNVAQMFGGNANSVLNQGNSLLGTLFSNTLVSGLSNSISRFSGLNPNMVKSLLACLAPVVLGKVASAWKNQGGGTDGLRNLFAGQRQHIADAIPAGFSLQENEAAARPYVDRGTTQTVAQKSPASWLVPAALAALAAFLVWQFLRPRPEEVARQPEPATAPAERVVAMKPELPEVTSDAALVTSATGELAGLFKSLDGALSSLQSGEAPDRAVAELSDLDVKIDKLSEGLSRLPESSLATLRSTMQDQAKAVVEKAYAIGAKEGIDARVKTLIQDIIVKIVRWFPSDKQ